MLLGSALVILIKVTVKIEALIDQFIDGLGALAQCVSDRPRLGAGCDIDTACLKALGQMPGKPVGICFLYIVLVKPLELI